MLAEEYGSTVTVKPGLFPTGTQIQSSAYPGDLLDSALALPKFIQQTCDFFQVC